MLRIEAPLFDLDACLASGQTFSWERRAHGAWHGWLRGTPCILRQEGPRLLVDAPSLGEEEVRAYFHLDAAWDRLLAALPPDGPLDAARTAHPGLRVIHDPWWECTAGFICSSLKQIPHIRAIHWNLRRLFSGRETDPWPDAAFPRPDQIASQPESLLRTARLGYRARHLHGAARLLAGDGFDFAALDGLATAEAAEALRVLPGVGDKVAHCILLYAGRRYDALPLDVWMIRLLRRHYGGPGRRLRRPADLHRFTLRRFGPARGIAQLFLFHHGRNARRADK